MFNFYVKHHTVFGKEPFINLDPQKQAKYILDYAATNEDAMLQIYDSQPGAAILSWLTTIVLRADCGCKLFGVYYDESTESVEELELSHDPECLCVRLPIIEDRSESTLRRRQRMEILAAPDTLRLLEEEANNHSGRRER